MYKSNEWDFIETESVYMNVLVNVKRLEVKSNIILKYINNVLFRVWLKWQQILKVIVNRFEKWQLILTNYVI